MGKAPKAGPGETPRRMLTYESLDSAAALQPGSAQRLCEAVRAMRGAEASGGAEGMKEARRLLRSALSVSGAEEHAAVYQAWVAAAAAAGDVAAARELVLDWGCVCAAEGTADEYAAFWIAYVAFELKHGCAGTARAVAADAARACPRDAAVRATCAMAGLGLDGGGSSAAGRPAPAPRCRWWTRIARTLSPSSAIMAVAGSRRGSPGRRVGTQVAT